MKKIKDMFDFFKNKIVDLPLPQETNIEIKQIDSGNKNPCVVDYNKLTVLVVEDNVFLIDIMEDYLKKNLISVETAGNGQNGLEKYLNNSDKYNIIFLDVQMPIMDGIETAKRIRASGKPNATSVLIIAMSGSLPSNDKTDELFNYYLKKPFRMDTVLDAINAVVNMTT